MKNVLWLIFTLSLFSCTPTDEQVEKQCQDARFSSSDICGGGEEEPRFSGNLESRDKFAGYYTGTCYRNYGLFNESSAPCEIRIQGLGNDVEMEVIEDNSDVTEYFSTELFYDEEINDVHVGEKLERCHRDSTPSDRKFMNCSDHDGDGHQCSFAFGDKYNFFGSKIAD